MHEMGIAMQIVEIASASIPSHLKDRKVERVNLRIGKLSAVVPESLRFCFEIVVQNTPLSGATLAVEEIPIVARCKDCHHEWSIEKAVFKCPVCDGGSVDIISGRELDIVSVEIADPILPTGPQTHNNSDIR